MNADAATMSEARASARACGTIAADRSSSPSVMLESMVYHVQAGDHYRRHRAGRILPRGIAAVAGLRSRGDGAPLERAEFLARAAPARSNHDQTGGSPRSAVADS